MELILMLVIAIVVVVQRINKNENTYQFIVKQTASVYNKYAPYSFKEVSSKVKKLGQEYTVRKYTIQVIIIAGSAVVVSYMYFYSIPIALIYGLVALFFVPYLAYLKYKKIYSDFIFEQIQVYSTNVIMEFQTTESFVKSLEGVAESGVLEDPLLSDVRQMIAIAYEDGVIDNAIMFFNNNYDYHIIKNMHQLFNQITKEGVKDADGSLENMLLDIDMLVEGVYRDRIDRQAFHKKFLQFGISLYLLAVLVQFLIGNDTYLMMLETPLAQILLHAIIIVNTYFLLNGEKFYYENVGAE